MKTLLHLTVLVFVTQTLIAQQDWADRLVVDENLAPFYHGVASGDPTQSSVILWTRVSPNDQLATRPEVTIPVEWYISDASNPAEFEQNIIQNGMTTTDATKDYTVRVEVQNLDPDKWYYYIFRSLGSYSIMGRTRTFPTDLSRMRFGVVSCSNFPVGFFNAYDDLANRNDIDAVFHLGDYLYEYGDDVVAPDHEMVTLDDYRTRFSFYRLDSMLRKAHQQYPWITVWDDHESTNDSWKDGAENHNPDNAYDDDDPSLVEGEWSIRKIASKKAYNEWMPIRVNLESGAPLYRQFSIGTLGDLFFLDTRIEGREEQLAIPTPASLQEERTILGQDQFNWLTNGLNSASGTWKIIPQQVMMAPLAVGVEEAPINMDQWDGYASERTALFNYVEDQNIDNMVVLTGDIHTAWAMELPHTRNLIPYAAGTYDTNGNLITPCSRSRGVEFVVWSVTSTGFPDGSNPSVTAIEAGNQHMRYVDIENHGYMILDLKTNRAQCDWFYVNTLASTDYEVIHGESWYVNEGETCLQQSQSPADPPLGAYPAPATNEFSALAVEWIDFYGFQEKGVNHLIWHTAVQEDTDYFQVERSVDAKNFKTIGKINSQSTTSSVVRYSFTDHRPLDNANYYRITEIDLNGTSTFSNIIQITTPQPYDRHYFYPNPADDHAILSFYNPTQDNILIQWYNLEGQLVKTIEETKEQGNQQIKMDIEDLPHGVYSVRIFHRISGQLGGGMVVKHRK